MEYKHINDCWNALEDAKTVEEVEDLFDDFPRWSGDWDWYVENGEVVVENTYYDDYSEVYGYHTLSEYTLFYRGNYDFTSSGPKKSRDRVYSSSSYWL